MPWALINEDRGMEIGLPNCGRDDNMKEQNDTPQFKTCHNYATDKLLCK